MSFGLTASAVRWQLSAASVRGKGHVDRGTPNQDAFRMKSGQDGRIVVAVLSDGAGTAPRAHEGSQSAVETLCSGLEAFAQGARKVTLPLFTQAVIRCIENLRTDLDRLDDLPRFHCTVVACMLVGDTGFIAHIGDSAALTTRFRRMPGDDGGRVDFFPDEYCRLHELDRGEYANETHFVTQADWRQYLRVEEIPAGTQAVMLMTDGAMDVAMSRGRVFRGFSSSLVAKLADTASQGERDATIEAWLDDPRTYAVTGDDKTLFVALRTDSLQEARRPFLTDPPESPKALRPTTSATPAPARGPVSAPLSDVPTPPDDSTSGAGVPPVPVAQLATQGVSLPPPVQRHAWLMHALWGLIVLVGILVLAVGYLASRADMGRPRGGERKDSTTGRTSMASAVSVPNPEGPPTAGKSPPESQSPASVSLVEIDTSDAPRFTVRSISSGSLAVHIRPPEGDGELAIGIGGTGVPSCLSNWHLPAFDSCGFSLEFLVLVPAPYEACAVGEQNGTDVDVYIRRSATGVPCQRTTP